MLIGVIDPFTAVLVALVVARVTRLIVADTIVDGVRRHLVGWWGAWVSCPWCVSVWVAAPVVASAVMWGSQGWWRGAALACGASYVTGFLSRFESDPRVEVFPVAPVTVQYLTTPLEPLMGVESDDDEPIDRED